MGYLCGFLLLLLGPQDVARVLHRVGTDPKYTPGYWKGQPEAFVRDAMVYMRLVEERLPVRPRHAARRRQRMDGGGGKASAGRRAGADRNRRPGNPGGGQAVSGDAGCPARYRDGMG